jgi:hypothetical protein
MNNVSVHDLMHFLLVRMHRANLPLPERHRTWHYMFWELTRESVINPLFPECLQHLRYDADEYPKCQEVNEVLDGCFSARILWVDHINRYNKDFLNHVEVSNGSVFQENKRTLDRMVYLIKGVMRREEPRLFGAVT